MRHTLGKLQLMAGIFLDTPHVVESDENQFTPNAAALWEIFDTNPKLILSLTF